MRVYYWIDKNNMSKFFKTKIIGLIPIFLFMLSSIGSAQQKKAVVIPISGMINYGLSAFIERAITGAKDLNPDIIIFEIDTFGGEVDAALKIVDNITAISYAKTISFVKTKAISAGALISLAANELVMVDGTTIGDCAPIIYSNEGPKMLGEKFQSPLRAKFRSLADKNGYPPKLAEAMVSEDIEILEIETKKGKQFVTRKEFNEYSENEKKEVIKKRIILEKGKLLTMHAKEAQSLGFSKYTAIDFNDFLKKYDLTKEDVLKRFKKMWSEKFVIFLDQIAPILLIVGLLGVYIEVKTPGFGIPGLIGVLCLTLVFGSKFFVGLANYTELLIFSLGIILLAIEVFVIPGFGVVGLLGILVLFVSLVLSFQNFVIPEFPWEYEIFYNNLTTLGIVFLINFILMFATLFYAGPSLAKSRIAHKGDESIDSGFRPAKDYNNLLGQTGITVTDLRPSGYAEIKNVRTNVVSSGEFIASGDTIKVIEIVGNRIVVGKI